MILPTQLDLWGTFTFYSLSNLLIALFVLLFLPETKGLHLEEIDDVVHNFLATPWYIRMSNVRLSSSSSCSSGGGGREKPSLLDGTTTTLTSTTTTTYMEKDEEEVDIEMADSEVKTEGA